jgi:hypothetical protein
MSRLWRITFLDRPAPSFGSGTDRASRFSRVEVPWMSGVFDHWNESQYRCTPRLHVPLSTFRAQPSTPPRRFIPAHLLIAQGHHWINF